MDKFDQMFVTEVNVFCHILKVINFPNARPSDLRVSCLPSSAPLLSQMRKRWTWRTRWASWTRQRVFGTVTGGVADHGKENVRSHH